MGNNNVPGVHRLRGSLPFPSTLQLGTYATINIKTSISNRRDDGSYAENAEVLYTVEGSKCRVLLKRFVWNGNVIQVAFIVKDICSAKETLSLPIFKDGTGLLDVLDVVTCSGVWTKTRKNFDAWGGVMDTKVYLYGTANRCGLLVLECKKNDYHERNAKVVTIAHYFVSSKESVGVNSSSETTDIGFSVVVKVGLGNQVCSLIAVTFGGSIAQCFHSLIVKTTLFPYHHVLVASEMERPLPTMEGSEDMLMVVTSEAEISMHNAPYGYN